MSLGIRATRLALSWGLLLVTLAGCASLVPVPRDPRPSTEPGAASPVDPEEASQAWSRVLAGFVTADGRVDFVALAAGRRDLETYVRHVAQTDPATIAAGNARLAHYINAYNALSIYNVIESGIPSTHAGWARFRFFWIRRLVVGGRPLSLYELENSVIRPLGDARVHYALNCSALSCPMLPRTPFAPASLDRELDREARAFFALPANLCVDHDRREVRLNSILDFYTEDFVPPEAMGDRRSRDAALLRHVGRYAPVPVPEDYRVSFNAYDWTVASAASPRPAEAPCP